jgi:hypothetical protein
MYNGLDQAAHYHILDPSVEHFISYPEFGFLNLCVCVVSTKYCASLPKLPVNCNQLQGCRRESEVKVSTSVLFWISTQLPDTCCGYRHGHQAETSACGSTANCLQFHSLQVTSTRNCVSQLCVILISRTTQSVSFNANRNYGAKLRYIQTGQAVA